MVKYSKLMQLFLGYSDRLSHLVSAPTEGLDCGVMWACGEARPLKLSLATLPSKKTQQSKTETNFFSFLFSQIQSFIQIFNNCKRQEGYRTANSPKKHHVQCVNTVNVQTNISSCKFDVLVKNFYLMHNGSLWSAQLDFPSGLFVSYLFSETVLTSLEAQ